MNFYFPLKLVEYQQRRNINNENVVIKYIIKPNRLNASIDSITLISTLLSQKIKLKSLSGSIHYMIQSGYR